MASKSTQVRQGQRDYWKNKLNQRLSVLADRGLEPEKIARDAAVRKIRAKLRHTQSRLKTIDLLEKKVQETARISGEKMAAPGKEKARKQKGPEEAPAMSKRRQKKKIKMESKV